MNMNVLVCTSASMCVLTCVLTVGNQHFHGFYTQTICETIQKRIENSQKQVIPELPPLQAHQCKIENVVEMVGNQPNRCKPPWSYQGCVP